MDLAPRIRPVALAFLSACTALPSQHRGLDKSVRTEKRPLSLEDSKALGAPDVFAGLHSISESAPQSSAQAWLKKDFWINRKIFVSLGVERASVTGLAMTVTGYIPAQLIRVGNTLVLQRLNTGLFGGSVLGPEISINGYPIVGESDTEILVDFAAPRTPYGLSMAGVYGGANASSELLPRFEYVKEIKTSDNTLTFTNVMTVKSNKALFRSNDDSAESLSELDPYMLSLTVRTDWVLPQEAPDFRALSVSDRFFGFFTSSPLVIKDGTSVERFAQKIDVSKPYVWEMSANTPDLFASSVEAGLKAWNEALGSEVLVVRRGDGTRSLTDPSVSNIVWDDNRAVGMAFANSRTNPYTGQIVQSQIYLSGNMWTSQAKLIYQMRSLEKTFREARAKSAGAASSPTAAGVRPRVPGRVRLDMSAFRESTREGAVVNAQPKRMFFSLNAGLATEQAAQDTGCARSVGSDDLKTLESRVAELEELVAEASPVTSLPVSTAVVIHLPYPRDVLLSSESFQKNLLRGVVMHESGHTLGLRHNFMGSTVSSDGGKIRSGSIMDYNDYVIDAEFTKPGDLDRAFIASIYQGVELPKNIRFCTDEQSLLGAPDCSPGDAFENPVDYYRAKSEADLLIGIRLAEKGSMGPAISLLTSTLRSVAKLAQIALAPTLASAKSLGDTNFATRQAQAWQVILDARRMYDIEWPAEIHADFEEMIVQLLTVQANPKAMQSILAEPLIKEFENALGDSAGQLSLETRLAALDGLKRLQSPAARLALRTAQVKLEKRFQTPGTEKRELTAFMNDDEVRMAIVNLFSKGYFARDPGSSDSSEN